MTEKVWVFVAVTNKIVDSTNVVKEWSRPTGNWWAQWTHIGQQGTWCAWGPNGNWNYLPKTGPREIGGHGSELKAIYKAIPGHTWTYVEGQQKMELFTNNRPTENWWAVNPETFVCLFCLFIYLIQSTLYKACQGLINVGMWKYK